MKTIVYIQYTNPAGYPSLEHGSRILADAGWRAIFLGTGAFMGSEDLSFAPHPGVQVRRLRFFGSRTAQKLNYARFCVWSVLRSLAARPSWIYASDPLSCPPALFLSYLGFRVVYHEHDSPGQAASVFMKFVLRARRRLARRAVFSVLPNEARTRDYKSETGGEAICVWNCPSLAEIGGQTPKRPDEIWLFYHGSLTPVRLPTALLDALALLPANVKLRVVGYGTTGFPGYIDDFRRHALALGLEGRIDIVGVVPTRKELLSQCSRSDVGIAFMPKRTEDRNEKDMVGASNKPFEYLARGLALLVSDIPAWRKAYVESGYGLACDPADVRSIADAVRRFVERPDEMRRMGASGMERVRNEWNYEAQFRPVFERLAGTGGGR